MRISLLAARKRPFPLRPTPKESNHRFHRGFSSGADGIRIRIVFGSFCNYQESLLDAKEMHEQIRSKVDASDRHIDLSEPVMGDAFDFDTLAATDFLLVSTSSWLGYPPQNLVDFSHQLKLAAETNPGW